MKKPAILLLVAAMLLCLCGCADPDKTADTPALQAGFGRVNITPDYPVPMAGYGEPENRMSKGILDDLYATCVALQDAAGETVLLYTCDTLYIENSLYPQYVAAISKVTGVKTENIILSASHTHSAPAQDSGHASMETYIPLFRDCLVQAAIDALADLSPATVKTGAVEVEGMNFVRHYLMNDGSYFGDNFGDSSSGFACHEREPDREMQLVQLVRTGKNKKDILMVNWQAHTKLASTAATTEGERGRYMLSADYIGPLRTYVEAETNVLLAYYMGATGNINPLSNITQEQLKIPQDHKLYGKKLGQYVLDALPALQQEKTGAVMVRKTLYPAQIDHTEDHLVQYALPVAERWKNTGVLSLSKDEAHGILSPYHALSIIDRAENPAAEQEMELNAISVGGIGFATAPYEMFCQNGQAIKAGSPFETTFILTCCNGNNAYIAAESAFQYNSYEVQNRTFVRGTAEAVQEELVAMLRELAG